MYVHLYSVKFLCIKLVRWRSLGVLLCTICLWIGMDLRAVVLVFYERGYNSDIKQKREIWVEKCYSRVEVKVVEGCCCC